MKHWRYLKKHADIYRFAQQTIALRKNHPVFRRTLFFTGLDLDGDQFRDVHWYNARGEDATWDPDSKCLMCTMDGSKEETGANKDDVDVLMMFNADTSVHLFCVPPPPHEGKWLRIIDTGLPAPDDICPKRKSVTIEPNTPYKVRSRSIVVMFSSWQR